MTTYFAALALTIAIESTFAGCWPRKAETISRRLFLTLIVGINLFTHPLAWLAHASTGAFVAVECAVVLIEACALLLIPGRSGRWMVGLAIAMNVASAAAGGLLMRG